MPRTSRRHKQPVTTAGLGKAFTGNGGHDGDPWRFVLTFWNTGGLAADYDTAAHELTWVAGRIDAAIAEGKARLAVQA